MRAHLLEAPVVGPLLANVVGPLLANVVGPLLANVVGPLLANEDRVDRRLHVVVDPARAGALEEGEGPVVGVEHHLLRLARVRTDEQHPAVAEPDMRDLHRHRRAGDQHNLVAPVELVGLARRGRRVGFCDL
jgi:hypothetical protein